MAETYTFTITSIHRHVLDRWTIRLCLPVNFHGLFDPSCGAVRSLQLTFGSLVLVFQAEAQFPRCEWVSILIEKRQDQCVVSQGLRFAAIEPYAQLPLWKLLVRHFEPLSDPRFQLKGGLVRVYLCEANACFSFLENILEIKRRTFKIIGCPKFVKAERASWGSRKKWHIFTSSPPTIAISSTGILSARMLQYLSSMLSILSSSSNKW